MVRSVQLFLMLAIAALLLAGCAGNTLIEKGTSSTLDANFNTILFDTNNHIGDWVVWGGEIINFVTLQNGTELTIRQIPLAPAGQPWRARYSLGKFIVRTPVKLDPTMYRLLTTVMVKGTVAGSVVKPLGYHGETRAYHFPVITPNEMHLWKIGVFGTEEHCWQAMGWEGPYRWKCGRP